MAHVSTPTAETELAWSSSFIKLATWAVVAFSVALPAGRVYTIAVLSGPIGATMNGRGLYAAIAVAAYLPVQTWLVLVALRRPFEARHLVGLAALAAVMFAMIPVVGVGWVGILYMLGALVLAGLQPPWSLALYAVLAISPVPLGSAFGRPDGAFYFTTGMLVFPVSMAVAIELIRAVRDLQQARLQLAHQAVLRERQRADDAVGRSLATRLVTIEQHASRAAEIAPLDSFAAASELRAVVDASRATLAEARRVISRHREVSMATELNTVGTLLSAAGINAQLEVPPDLPDRIDESDRMSIRRQIAHLLETTAPHPNVTVAVTRQGDRLIVTLLSEPRGSSAQLASR